MDKRPVYKCVIIDDEPIALKVIKEHLEKLNQIECIDSYTKPLEAIKILNDQKVDLLILDINMPGISGIEFLKSLSNPPKVIFTTAYRNFAVDAFELDALDYLVKPISFERFLKAVNKFFKQTDDHKKIQVNLPNDYIILKADKKNYKIKLTDILFIESLDNYVKVNTSKFSIICYESLSKLEKELGDDFIRIHRSYIINITKIDVFTSSYIEINDRRLTIGRNYKEDVGNKLNS